MKKLGSTTAPGENAGAKHPKGFENRNTGNNNNKRR